MGDNKVVSGFGGHFLYASQYRSDEITVQLMQNHSNRIRLLLAEVAGEIIMPVAQLFRRILYFLAGIFIDRWMIPQAPAYRGGGERKLLRNVVYRNLFLRLHVYKEIKKLLFYRIYRLAHCIK